MRKHTPRRARRVLIAAATATIAIALTACTGGTAAPNGEPSAEKDYSQLRLASSTAQASWNPALQTSAFDGIWQWTAVYDTLLTCNQDGSVGPGAAEDFTFTDDNTNLTMTLREGMTFEDGTPVDAAAVKASIEHMQTGGGSGAVRVAGLTVSTPDERTITVTAPASQGLLATYMCLSPGIIASPAAIASAELDSVPVSSGPYTFDADKSTSGSVLTFTKRDDYWNADAYPYEEIVVTIMTDVTARLNALKTGQVDGATLSAQTFAEAEASALSVVNWVDATNGIVIFDRDGTIVPALAEPKVRQALNMVFDREGIAKGLFQGLAEPTTQMFGPETEGFVAALDKEYAFDIDAAQTLMAEAGYPDGFTIEIPSRTPQNDQANPLIVQQFAELGITVTETPIAGATAVPELLSGRFPMTYISMPLSSGLWSVQQEISADATWNVKHNTTPELAALTATAQSASGEDLTKTLQEINRYVVDNAWFIPWNTRTAYFGTATDVNVDGTPDPYFQIPQLKSFN